MVEEGSQGIELQVVVFMLHEEQFGLDVQHVIEIAPMVDITKLPNAANGILGVMNLRGQVIPVMELATEFGFSPVKQRSKNARIVVVAIKGTTIGLLVDDVLQVTKLTHHLIKAVPEFMSQTGHAHYIKGVVNRKNQLMFMLDLSSLTITPTANTEQHSQEGEHHG